MIAGQQEILDIFTRTRALLQGHFVLRSGLHSGHYFQCAQVCQRMDAVQRLAELLLARVHAQGLKFSTVLAPAMGGLVIGQEIARQAGARYIFAEKENNALVMRRGFTLTPNEQVLIVEDGAAHFEVPAISLLELSFPTFPADAVPDWLAKLPIEKPGS
jgi:orotate phosphoribosyltransferase